MAIIYDTKVVPFVNLVVHENMDILKINVFMEKKDPSV